MIDKASAEKVFEWATQQNPGRWVEHSKNVARAAQAIAAKCGLDSDKAYICGLLHDIGRYEGNTGSRHALEGYRELKRRGLDEIANITVMHSFFDGTSPGDEWYLKLLIQPEDRELAKELAEKIRSGEIAVDDYSYLIQLCDCIALERGIISINDRFMDLMIRYPEINWRHRAIGAYKLKLYFDQKAGDDIFKLFEEEITKNTFILPDGIKDLIEKGEL